MKSSNINVLLFAGARELIGHETIQLDMPLPCSLSTFQLTLFAKFPQLRPYENALRVAINASYALSEDMIHEGDEVALIPPVAGG